MIVNSELVGIPAQDAELVKGWTEDFIGAINAGGANVPVQALERATVCWPCCATPTSWRC